MRRLEQRDRDLLLSWKKKQYLKLNEILSATEQLAKSMDRNDRVAVGMCVSMREDPIRQAQELQEMIESYLLKMPEQDAIRANEILTGGLAEESEEQPLCEQVAQNRRLLNRIMELDKFVSKRFGGAHSYYNTFR